MMRNFLPCLAFIVCHLWLQCWVCDNNAYAEDHKTIPHNVACAHVTSETTKSKSLIEFEKLENSLLGVPHEQRNYAGIVKQFEEFCKKHPHTIGFNKAVSLVRRWVSEKIINKNDARGMFELADAKRDDIEEAKQILATFDSAIQANDIGQLSKIANELEIFVKKDNIGNEAKYIVCAQLATIFQRTGNFLKARDYAKQYIDNFSPDAMDFSGAEGFLFISLQASVNYTLMTEGVLPAVNQWENITVQFSDYSSLVMDAYVEGIAVAFAHHEKEEGAALCEKFIDKYPDSKDSRIFDARLSLIANILHPKNEKLNPLKDKKVFLQRVHTARKEALILLNDFEGTPLAENVVVFLATLKEMEDICKDIVVQRRGTFDADNVLPISPSRRMTLRVIVVIVNLAFIIYVFYRLYKKIIRK